MQIKAFAKVNFTLEVFGEREDGYHALRSLIVPISLHDTLHVELRTDGQIISDSPFEDDLCIKAAFALRSSKFAKTLSNPGAEIKIEKHIPAGGGLGGGSADAAATLSALNSLWKLDLPREALAEVAALVGSDVPSLVLGGPVLMEGRGEKVSKFSDFSPISLVLANPGVFSSTKEVYKKCLPRVTDEPKILYNIADALQSGNIDSIANALLNDLEDAAIALHPEIAATKQALKACGIQRPLMSGSGSTVFGLVHNEDEGRKITNLLVQKGYKAWSATTVVR